MKKKAYASSAKNARGASSRLEFASVGIAGTAALDRESCPAYRVFISYSNQDRAHAERLREVLASRPDIGAIFDASQLRAGEPFVNRLKDELARADFFFIVISPDALRSAWVLTELGAAWAQGTTIIPVLTDRRLLDKMPIQLQGAVSLPVEDLEDAHAIDAALGQSGGRSSKAGHS